MIDSPVDVLVVGGGPVGLLLGCRLAGASISVRVLEQRARPVEESRAIGIHAPSLERFAQLGVVDAFLREGVRIDRGHAFSSRGLLGSVDLSARAGAFPFALSLPQQRSEEILAAELARRDTGALRRGVKIVDVASSDSRVAVTGVDATGQKLGFTARYVVGCDGRNSAVRAAMGVDFVGASRPESYVMGDYADDTELGSDAAVFLADEGLVESFPLPLKRRRWVLQVARPELQPSARLVARLATERTGHAIRAETVSMVSGFGVEQRRASALRAGPRLLAGDAAHVVSPFGGQGMNLGWLAAWDLADCFGQIFGSGADPQTTLQAYEQRRIAAYQTTAHRAALNGRLGRRSSWPRLRNAAVATAMRLLPQRRIAELFTMYGIE